MKENVGSGDRLIRSVTGPALMAMGYRRWGGDRGRVRGLMAIVAGTLLLESAVTRVCPVNALLGLDTRSAELMERDLREARIAYEEGTPPVVRQESPQMGLSRSMRR